MSAAECHLKKLAVEQEHGLRTCSRALRASLAALVQEAEEPLLRMRRFKVLLALGVSERTQSLASHRGYLDACMLGAQNLNMQGRRLRSARGLLTRTSMRLVQPAWELSMTGVHPQALVRILPAQKLNLGEMGEVQCSRSWFSSRGSVGSTVLLLR